MPLKHFVLRLLVVWLLGPATVAVLLAVTEKVTGS
jgi:hypothetical protein